MCLVSFSKKFNLINIWFVHAFNGSFGLYLLEGMFHEIVNCLSTCFEYFGRCMRIVELFVTGFHGQVSSVTNWNRLQCSKGFIIVRTHISYLHHLVCPFAWENQMIHLGDTIWMPSYTVQTISQLRILIYTVRMFVQIICKRCVLGHIDWMHMYIIWTVLSKLYICSMSFEWFDTVCLSFYTILTCFAGLENVKVYIEVPMIKATQGGVNWIFKIFWF